MKRALKWVGLVVLLLVIAAASVWYSAFGNNSPIVDGQQVVSGVETVKDGFVSVFVVDAGPGKREWSLILICANEMTDFTGQRIANTGLQLRNHLVTTYNTRAAVSFTDLDGTAYSVHFDDYAEQVRSPRTQLLGPSYHCTIVLVEA